MDNSEFKPCPFCASRDCFIEQSRTGWWHIECNDCEAEGPYKEGIPEAITAWNTRPCGITEKDQLWETTEYQPDMLEGE